MSILLKPTRLINAEAERTPLRLSPAEAAEIVRVGYVGDAPVEPARSATDPFNPFDPSNVEARVESIAAELAAEHGGCKADFARGAYRTEYRHLWSLYQAKLVELDRRRFEFWPDETPVQDWTPADDEPALCNQAS